ncbi:MAG: magnesium transporter CorA family protein [Acetobacteraceae bacterium]
MQALLYGFTCETGRPTRIPSTASIDALREAVWIDLVNATPEEIDRVQAATGIAVPTEAEISEIETSSRLSARNGMLYINMPLVSMADGPRAVSVGFVLGRDRLITIRFAGSRSFDAYADQLPRGETLHETAAHIFVGLMEAIIDRQADSLEGIRNDLEKISHRIFRLGARGGSGSRDEDARLRHTLSELGTIGDLISHIRDTQVAAARVVPYVETVAADWLPKDIRARLRTLRRDIASVSDFDTHLNDKLQFMLDATLGFINIAQNNLMKVMTITSVAGIPPVLVAGIYGMNFKYMPELDWGWGYAWGLGWIVISTVIPLLIFRWRKWI